MVVRSHAMQAFLREKKLDGKNTAKREPEVQVKSLDEAIGRFKLSSWSRKSSKKASSAAKNETIPKQATNDSIAKISMKRPKDLHPMPSPVRVTLRSFELAVLTKQTAIHPWTTGSFWNLANRPYTSDTKSAFTL